MFRLKQIHSLEKQLSFVHSYTTASRMQCTFQNSPGYFVYILLIAHDYLIFVTFHDYTQFISV